jgi:TRAP-type C4-dicarboxylate transport system permease small subunit
MKKRASSAMKDGQSGTILIGLANAIRKVSRVSFYAGSGLLFVIMFLVTFDVTGRYLFNSPLLGNLEITEFLLAGAVLLGLAYTQDLHGNVDLELLYNHFPKRAQKFLDILPPIIGIGLFTIVCWESGINAIEGWQKNLTSDVLRIPAWPFLLFVPVGTCLLVLVLCCQLFQSLIRTTSPHDPPKG